MTKLVIHKEKIGSKGNTSTYEKKYEIDGSSFKVSGYVKDQGNKGEVSYSGDIHGSFKECEVRDFMDLGRYGVDRLKR